jgi:hypothetical protein
MPKSIATVVVAIGLALGIGIAIVGMRMLQSPGRRAGAVVLRRPAVPASKSHPPVQRENLARLATITASSAGPGSQFEDGAADEVRDNQAWVAEGETSGAWIKLEWNPPVLVAEVELYDRPNRLENVLAGRLLFDDGTTVAVPPLPPDGSVWRTNLPPRSVRSLTFHIDGIQGSNAGLARIAVHGPIVP